MSTFNLRNTKRAEGLGGTLIRMAHGSDPIWMGWSNGYVLRTWEPLENGRYDHGSTADRIEIQKRDDGNGWDVVLFGEAIETVRTKNDAQTVVCTFLDLY